MGLTGSCELTDAEGMPCSHVLPLPAAACCLRLHRRSAWGPTSRRASCGRGWSSRYINGEAQADGAHTAAVEDEGNHDGVHYMTGLGRCQLFLMLLYYAPVLRASQGLPFWKFATPIFHRYFPHTKDMTHDDFYRLVNRVSPGKHPFMLMKVVCGAGVPRCMLIQ